MQQLYVRLPPCQVVWCERERLRVVGGHLAVRCMRMAGWLCVLR